MYYYIHKISVKYKHKNTVDCIMLGRQVKRRHSVSFLSLENVGKVYKSGEIEVAALKNVSLELTEGDFAVILGSSGAGKTTLLNLLGGMDNATSGKIFLGGKDVTSLDKKGLCDYRRNDVGFVFQFYNLMPNLTALENVEIAVEICKNHLSPEETLKQVGLENRLGNFPAQLSGGEQQRVSIARAIAKNPKLLLCDEPTGALDYATGKKILKCLYDVSKKNGKTVVVVTHNQAIKDIADKVFYIKSGEIEKSVINENPKNADEIEW